MKKFVEASFQVDVTGLPPIYMDAKSPTEIRKKLRRQLKFPDDIESIKRITKGEKVLAFKDRLKTTLTGKGKDVEEAVQVDELYTIGHTRSYDAGANRSKENMKHGSTDPQDKRYGTKIGASKGEHGGAAYKTTKDATKGAKDLKKDFPGRKYSVYKMKGDFDKDTYHSKKTGMNHVKRDTEITHKALHNVTEVSQKTLTSYIKKASDQLEKGKVKDVNKIGNRAVGIDTAVHGIRKNAAKGKTIKGTIGAPKNVPEAAAQEDMLIDPKKKKKLQFLKPQDHTALKTDLARLKKALGPNHPMNKLKAPNV